MIAFSDKRFCSSSSTRKQNKNRKTKKNVTEGDDIAYDETSTFGEKSHLGFIFLFWRIGLVMSLCFRLHLWVLLYLHMTKHFLTKFNLRENLRPNIDEMEQSSILSGSGLYSVHYTNDSKKQESKIWNFKVSLTLQHKSCMISLENTMFPSIQNPQSSIILWWKYQNHDAETHLDIDIR